MFFKFAQKFTSSSIKCCNLITKRNISISKCFQQSPSASGGTNPGSNTYKPNNLEKRFLVWSGKYKSIEDVPTFVSNEAMERTRNKIRIRLANIMMVGTIVGCILMVISGKRAVERGESVAKMNLDWHKKYNEEHADPKPEAK